MLKGLSTGIRVTHPEQEPEQPKTEPAQTAPTHSQPVVPAAGNASIRGELQMSSSLQQANLMNQLAEVKLPAQPEATPTRGWGNPFGSGPGRDPLVINAGRQSRLMQSLVEKQDANRQQSYVKLPDRNEAGKWAMLPETLSTGAGNDTVDISMGGDGRVHVNVNGKEAWSGSYKEFQTLTIDTGDGNDTVTNRVDGATIQTGKGDDFITNQSGRSSIETGDGHDTVKNTGYENQIKTDAGNDMVYSTGSYNQINTGQGGDLVVSTGGDNRIQTAEGDDHVYMYQEDDRERRQFIGSDNQVDTGGGSDFVSNSTSNATIRTGDGHDNVRNEGKYAKIDTGEGEDYVENSGEYSSINTGGGNDYVNNIGGQGTRIAMGDGDDLVTISENKDYVREGYSYVLGAGADARTVYEPERRDIVDPVKVDTGEGNDRVEIKDGSKAIIDREE
jgi:Ca2+-binding RTX toxin-like protein